MKIFCSYQRLTLLLLLVYAVLVVQGYKTIVDVLSEDERFSTLITHLQHKRLITTINKVEVGTFFAPDNSAFENYGKEVTRETLLYHLLPRQFRTSDLKDGQILESSYIRPGFLGSEKGGQLVKITEKLKTVLYINEARIKDKDIFVNRNTTLNVISRVLEPPKILSDIVEQHDGKLFDLMEKVKIDKILSQEKPFTTFVSAKFLLNKFTKVEQTYLTSEYGTKDLEHILKFLVIPQVVTLDNLPTGETTYTTESGEEIKIIVSANGKVTINGHRVVEKDILAANGVLHILDDLPYANSITFTIKKYLYGLNATKFVSLLDDHGLGKYLSDEASNSTLLVPTNEVIDEDDIPNNQKVQWLKYHIVNGIWGSSDLKNRMLLKTHYVSAQLDNQPQRLFVTLGEDGSSSDSIRFGDHSKVIGSEIAVHDNIIYRISDPLSLPYDIFTSLIVDINLSTFIASLYASGALDTIQHAKSISLFVPSNDAFRSLGLVQRYLLHPSGRADLQAILKYHVVTSTLYRQDLVGDILEVNTLANESLFINGNNKDNQIWIGNTNSDDDTAVRGVLKEWDTLVTNGVVHKVDNLLIPTHVNITQRNLLHGIKANTMLNILKETRLLETIDFTDYVILSPTDKAFEQVDMAALFNDTESLTRLAKLHIIPKSEGRRRWYLYPFLGDQVYESLLSSKDRLVIRDVGFGNLVVRVKGESYSTHARVLDVGRVSTGDRSGGVMEIDSVLFPVERGIFGLPWIWSIAVLSASSFVGVVLMFLISFVGYKKWKRSRDGYVPIADSSTTEQENENTN